MLHLAGVVGEFLRFLRVAARIWRRQELRRAVTRAVETQDTSEIERRLGGGL